MQGKSLASSTFQFFKNGKFISGFQLNCFQGQTPWLRSLTKLRGNPVYSPKVTVGHEHWASKQDVGRTQRSSFLLMYNGKKQLLEMLPLCWHSHLKIERILLKLGCQVSTFKLLNLLLKDGQFSHCSATFSREIIMKCESCRASVSDIFSNDVFTILTSVQGSYIF